MLSGGLDSSALAFLVRPHGAVVIDYGQRPAEGEIRAAKAIAQSAGIELGVLRVDASAVGSGLLNRSEPLPESPSSEWWPFRNQLLVTLAAAWAVPRGYQEILVGSLKTDSFHIDGSAPFYAQLARLIGMQECHLRVSAPAIKLTAVELLVKSGIPRSALGWTLSCHRGPFACGDCPGCEKHMTVLLEAGML